MIFANESQKPKVGIENFIGFPAMMNKRYSPRTLRCTWCHQVRSGPFWVADRRRTRTGAYANVVCQRCRYYYLQGFDLEGFLAWLKEEAAPGRPNP